MALDQYSLDDVYLRTWDAIRDACHSVGGHTKTISKYIDSDKPYCGFLWRYATLKDLADEEWRGVPFSTGRYAVSNLGRVRCEHRPGKWRLVSVNKEDGASRLAFIEADGSIKAHYVHKLVARLWLPSPEDGKTLVMHINGDKTNNRACNLAWTNFTERSKDVVRPTSRRVQQRDPATGAVIATYASPSEAQRTIGLKSSSTILTALKNNARTAKKFKWTYEA